MKRVLSGMRPTGSLHLGHLCGVLENWCRLQEEAECFFFVADWHALTTDYAHPKDLSTATREMIISWLVAGINPDKAVLFVQSKIPQHAELYVLLSMICPLNRLEQMPTYREQKDNMNQNLETYGFLGYPLLQSADILAYRADYVPVGEDQLPHIEFTRDIARRVNRYYGRSDGFEKNVRDSLVKLSPEHQTAIKNGVHSYRENGDEEALKYCLNLIENLSCEQRDKTLLRGYCLYDADEILPAPEGMLTPASRLLGTDGRKMSKSYNNTIDLFDSPKTVEKKLLQMQTDPARVRRHDKGNPDNCPVWSLHKHFSNENMQQWVNEGCRSADIGCVDCKKQLVQNITTVLEPFAQKRMAFEKDDSVQDILNEGTARAQEIAEKTLSSVRKAMFLTQTT